MCLLFLTQIAQTALSLFNVSHFFILDNIPEISLWEQIVARGIRYAGHMDLEPKERVIKIYTLVPSSPDLKEITKHEQKWIDIYEDENKIQQLYEYIRGQSYNAEKLLTKIKPTTISVPYYDDILQQTVV